MSPSLLARVLRAAADECDAIAAEASAERSEMVDQRRSVLGNRRHVRIVQQLVGEGSSEAAIVGRRHLLTQAAITAELAKLGKSKSVKPARESVADELRRELYLVKGPSK